MKLFNASYLEALSSDAPRTIYAKLCLLVSVALVLVSCGGGGGGSSPPPPPRIAALLFGFTPASSPAGFPNALVAVLDASTNAPIATATVTMNGVPLQFNSAPNNLEYEGIVVVSPGDTVTLSVTVGGRTYAASGNQPTTYPSISAPVAGDAWAKSSANTVSWSPGAPLMNVAAYLIGVVNGALPTGSPVYFQAVASTATSTTIPAGALSLLTAGSQYVIVGLTLPVPVSGAAAGSAFVPGGYSTVPITLD